MYAGYVEGAGGIYELECGVESHGTSRFWDDDVREVVRRIRIRR